MDPVYIRPDRKKNLKIAGVIGIFILYFFLGPYEYTRLIYKESPNFTYLLGLVFFGLFIFYLRQALLQTPEIILTEEGIEIRGNGWYNWVFVDSYIRTIERDIENHNDKEYLILHLKGNQSITCIISDLDKDSYEILDLIRIFKENSIRLEAKSQ